MVSTYTSPSYNGEGYGWSNLDELASRLEALVARPPGSIAENASRKRLLEAMKRAIPELETPAEAGAWLVANLREGDAVLLKASRGVRLEAALAILLT